MCSNNFFCFFGHSTNQACFVWLVPNIFGWQYDTVQMFFAYLHQDKPGAFYFLVGVVHVSPTCHNPLPTNGYLSLPTWSQVHLRRGERKPTCRPVLSQQLWYDLPAVMVITKWLLLHHHLHKSWFIAFGAILIWRCTFLKL
jgi:hypothetical protein